MIEVDVSHRSGTFNLSVRFSAGAHAMGVFGPSGAGKSTLISLIAGLESPDRGTIAVDGETLYDAGLGLNVPAHRRRIGVVFQQHRLFPHLSVRGNLRYGRPRGGDGEAFETVVRQVIDLLELASLLDRHTTEISGGESQRVALGRALISRPRLLLLDEPLTSLDLRLKQQIIPFLQRVRDETRIPMLYVSHDLTELLQMTDQLLVLDKGSLVAQGKYGDLAHNDDALAVIHDRGFRNVFTGRVVAHAPQSGTTELQLGRDDDAAHRLLVPLCAASRGETVTVAIHPWDVALAAEPVDRISIQNQIRGTVSRCTLHERSAIVEVDIGVPLLVEVSLKSAKLLGIVAGTTTTCLIKSHAIQRIDRA